MIPERLPDPYPSPGFTGSVQLVQSGDVDWTLIEPLTYRALDGTLIEVPRASSTDGASVPRACSWLVPRSGRYLPAAIVHDRCYRVLVPSDQMTYQRADAILVEAMRLLGVSFLLRWTIWTAVRLAGLFRGRAGRKGWHRDAPAVLAVLACPTSWAAIAASALVAVALLVWWLVELVVYAALLAQGRSDRYVNPPRDLTRR